MRDVVEAQIRRFFRFSLELKGIFALIETIGGIIIFAIPTQWVLDTVVALSADELADDPHDFIYTHILGLAQGLSVGGQTFAAWYLFSHGVIKLALIVGLLRDKLWAYPASLVVFGGFIVYQMYRYTHTHSIGLIVLTILDLVVMWLVWHEYRLKLQSHQSSPQG